MAARGRGKKLSSVSSESSSPGRIESVSPILIDATTGESQFEDASAGAFTGSRAVRPGFGTSGKPIQLICNHFEIRIPDTRELWRYDLLIEQGQGARKTVWTSGKAQGLPRKDIRDRCYKVFLEYVSQCNLNLYELYYDRQKMLYSLHDLRELGEMKTVTVKMGNELYMVQLAACNPPTVVINRESLAAAAIDTAVNTKDRSVLQILDIITNQFLFYMYAIKETDYMHFGRYFYKPKGSEQRGQEFHFLPYGRMIYEGFFKSLRLVLGHAPSKSMPAAGPQMFVTLNVDSKKAPFFYKQNLIETVIATLSDRRQNADLNRPLADYQIRLLNVHLKELRVRTLHMKRTFVMASFSNVPSCEQKFKLENGRETNVFEYMRQKYGFNLKYPFLPCVRKRGGRRGPNDWTYFPIEMCEILAHQKVDLNKTTEEQSRELIRVSAVQPERRLKDIIQKANELDHDERNGEDPFCKAFGLTRCSKPMSVSGRVLDSPKILYSANDRNGVCEVVNGEWKIGSRVHCPATIGPQFAICCFGDVPMDKIRKFVHNLINACQSLGINISSNYIGDYVKESTIDSVFKFLSEKCRFALCIMDDRSKGDRLKNAVKYAEVKYTIITQCIRPRTIFKCVDKPHDEIYKNMALKINLKNGGINNEIDLRNDSIGRKWLRSGVMFVGMDVNHAPPLSKAEIAMKVQPKEPSVLGAVANCGRTVSDYRMRYYLQDMRQEQGSEKHLKNMVTYFVEQYKENHDGRRPESIVWYRDGVSESQFKMVLEKEVWAIKRAFAEMNPPYDPKLTMITVQKRHNTRFFRESLMRTDFEQLRQMKCRVLLLLVYPSECLEKNLPPGTVVDTGPVTVHVYDFFLCSHVGIQGTSKPTYYSILLDENNFSADELQHLTYLLCHGYQRCTKSVSLPAPVYHAHHVASRGKANYLADHDSIDSSSVSSVSSEGSPMRANVPINYDDAQRRIEYGPLIGDRMIWA